MKKAVIIILIFSIMSGFTAFCDDNEAVKVMLDDQYISFMHDPVIMHGRVLVPLRGIFEEFGATLDYDPDVMVIKASQGKKRVMMSVGVDTAIYENGAYKKTMKLDMPPTNIAGVTYVPVRFAAESFDMKVDWDAKNRTVVIINLEPLWKRFKDEALTLYGEFFAPQPLKEKSSLTGKTTVAYTSWATDKDNPDKFSFTIDTQGMSDSKAEQKNSYVGIDAKGPSFAGISIPANVNFTTILRNNQYYIRTDLWSSMNNMSLVKKYDSMWIKAGAEGSETIPYYIMFGLNMKKLIDAYIKDASFKVNIHSYKYLVSVVDSLIDLEKTSVKEGKEGNVWVTSLEYQHDGLNAMAAMGNREKKINLKFDVKKTEALGGNTDTSFKLKIAMPDGFDFSYENSQQSKTDHNIPDVQVVPETSVARYDDISDVLRMAELLIKIMK